jgi:drug/metabolite transporter (DMT)-like permease
MGELAAVITSLVWAIGIFPFTQATQRMGALPVNNFRLALAMILLSLGLFAFYGLSIFEQFTIPTTSAWLWLGVSGVIGLAIGDYFGFSSFAILGPRLSSIFSTISPGVALILGLSIGNDSLNSVGFIGMLLTICGVLLVLFFRKSKNPTTNKSPEWKKGLLFAFLSAVCQGVGIVLSKMGLEGAEVDKLNPLHAAWIRMVAATVAAYVLATAQGRLKEITMPVIENKNKGIYFLLAGTMCGPVIGMSTSMVALSMISASVAQTIFSLVPVFVLLIAILYYKEKINMASFLGSLIAIIGVVVLIWRNDILNYF